MPGFRMPRGVGPCAPPEGTGPASTAETARVYRYLVEIIDSKDLGFYVSKCTRPSPDIDIITFHHGQDEIQRPGKNRWKPVSFTFYELLADGNQGSAPRSIVAKYLYDWYATTMISLTESKHGQLSGYLRQTNISLLDGGDQEAGVALQQPNTVWYYELFDTWPSNISPADLAYSATDIAEITVTLQVSKVREQ